MFKFFSQKKRRVNRISSLVLLTSLAVSLLPTPGFTVSAAESNPVVTAAANYIPTSISLAPGADVTKLNFAWYSNVQPVATIVQMAKKADMTDGTFPVEKALEFTGTASKASTTAGITYYSNKADASGLELKTKYVYRVGDGTEWSQVYDYATANPENYSILYVGDPQIGAQQTGSTLKDAEAWANTLKKAVTAYPDINFIMSAGDQVETGNSEPQYDYYTAPEQLRNLPVATTVGNHDTKVNYQYHFNTPNESTFGKIKDGVDFGGDYYYTYGDALFMVLNTNNTSGTEHRKFMEQTVAANPDTKWRFVTLHQDIYGAGAQHSQSTATLNLRAAISPIIDDLSIDLVFTGHDHSYSRTLVMNKGKVQNPKPEDQLKDDQGRAVNPAGTTFFTANSSTGSKYYELAVVRETYTEVRKQDKVPTFSIINITPEAITYNTYRTDTMALYDTYTMVKEPENIKLYAKQNEQTDTKSSIEYYYATNNANAVKNLDTTFKFDSSKIKLTSAELITPDAGAFTVDRSKENEGEIGIKANLTTPIHSKVYGEYSDIFKLAFELVNNQNPATASVELTKSVLTTLNKTRDTLSNVEKNKADVAVGVSVTEVALNKPALEIGVGGKSILTATVQPTNATNQDVVWKSSDESVATVDENGKVTGVSVGNAKITVTTVDGGFTATSNVEVSAGPIVLATSVLINEESLELPLSESGVLTATVLPENATNHDVSWSSSDESIATIDAYGKVTGLKIGTTVITVKTEDGSNKTANITVTVKVENIAVTDVTLDKPTLILTTGGAAQTLRETVNPSNATNKSVTWSSSNPEVATVNNGEVTPVAAGTTIITVTTVDGSKTAISRVTVNAPTVSVTGVTLDKSALIFTAGGAAQTLKETVNPGDATNKAVTWVSSNPVVATVSNGVVTPLAAGTTTITVTTVDGSKTAISTVTVNAQNTLLSEGSEWKYHDQGADLGTAWRMDDVSSWKSGIAPFGYKDNGSIVTSPLFGGHKTEILYGPNKSNKYITTYFRTTLNIGNVDFYEKFLGNFSIDDGAVMYVNGVEIIRMEMPPGEIKYDTPSPSGLDLPWVKKDVDLTEALRTNLRNGDNLIAVEVHQNRASSSDLYFDMNLKAIPKIAGAQVPVTGVVLDKSTLTFTTGGAAQTLKETVNGDAANKAVTWSSSNTAVATVNNGVVTPVAAGSAIITVTTVDGSKIATSTVTVIAPNVPVTGVTLDKATLTFTTGGVAQTLKETVNPGDATNKAVTWSSSNTAVATVNNGVVTPVAVGTAIITVTTVDGNKTATSTVAVNAVIVPVTGVTLDKATLTFTVGGAAQTLKETVNPNNATNKNVTWSSSNTAVATVNNGVVTPVAVGTANITVTTVDGSKTATSTITVNAAIVPVTGVTLDKSTLTFTVGGAAQTLKETVNPNNATNKNVTWSSSNTAVATVNNGVVTPVAAGSAIITVTTVDGSKTATSTVTVNAASEPGGGGSTPAPTPTPTPTPTTTPKPTPSADVKATTVTSEQLSKSGSEGKSTVTVSSNVTEVKLPSNAAELLGKNKLEITSDKMTLDVPSDLIKQLESKFTSNDLKDSSISLKFNPLPQSEAKDIVAQGGTASNAIVKISGEVYEFTLTITSKEGKVEKLTQFNQPITIRLKVDPSFNPKLVGIYYISDSGKLELIEGNYINGEMVAQISHFSKYAVLEYNKNFKDLTSTHWAFNVVQELAAKQAINGTSDTTFEPGRAITRAEFTTLLVNSLKLTQQGQINFTDVAANAWYAQAVSIAYEAGIVKGKTATTFDPNGKITREEMVTMMMKAYELKNGKAPANTIKSFADETKVSSWAVDYVKKAAELHLIKGRTADLFDPKGITTRAEAAQAIYNLLDK